MALPVKHSKLLCEHGTGPSGPPPPTPPLQVLGILATVLQRDADERGGAFNGRPYFRLCIGFLAELSPADPATDEVGLQYLQVWAAPSLPGTPASGGERSRGADGTHFCAHNTFAQPGGCAEAPLQHGACASCSTSTLVVPPSLPL